MTSLKDRAEKPDIADFRVEKQIGEGNFSRIVKVTYKPTGEVFALKIVEKQRVKRLRIRHANIFNEIGMEKDVLNKLRHANVIRLYHTFQDNDNLYFLLEFLGGGELLDHLMHEGRQIGLHEDMARFYLADVVNAVEFVHANKIVHRDLKPENMVVCKDTSHLKLIDFGTAKNLEDTTLNGPNFVGTPEYMSPETIDNKDVTFASDLWAVGCILYQLLTGETPFSGGSAYLTFLKVQDGGFQLPEYLSEEAKDLITKLLTKDPALRIAMKEIKEHPFFRGIDFENHMQATLPSLKFQNIGLLSFVKELEAAEKRRSEATTSAQKPLDFTGDRAQQRIAGLSPQDRSLLMHLLKRKQILHLSGIYPRFFDSASLGRCRYAADRGYVGFTHDLQNQWSDCFSFLQLAGPRLSREAAEREQDSRGGSTWESEMNAFRRAIGEINKQKPAFVAICGDFVHAEPGQEFYDAQIRAFQQLVNEIHPDTRLVFIPGGSSSGDRVLTELACESYERNFGDAHYSFWLGGMKFIVLDTSLLCHSGDQFADKIKQQEDWFKKELENGKLCAKGTIVLCFHSLCDNDEKYKSTENNGGRQAQDQVTGLSMETRKKYLELITSAKASLLVTSHPISDQAFSITTKVKDAQTSHDHDDDDDESHHSAAEELHKCDVLHCKTMAWGSSSSSNVVIHAVNVTQAGITTERCVVKQHQCAMATATQQQQPQEERKAVPAPEESDHALSLDGVKLDVGA